MSESEHPSLDEVLLEHEGPIFVDGVGVFACCCGDEVGPDPSWPLHVSAMWSRACALTSDQLEGLPDHSVIAVMADPARPTVAQKLGGRWLGLLGSSPTAWGSLGDENNSPLLLLWHPEWKVFSGPATG